MTTLSCSSMDLGTSFMIDHYVDDEHIRSFIESGKVDRLDSTVSTDAERYLEQSFPLRNWATIINWDKIPSTTLEWNKVSDDEAVAWAMSTTICRCTYGLLLYDAGQPCLIGTVETMIRNLDALVWKAPGCRILFGVDRDENGRIVFGLGAIEFNGKGELFATTDS